MKGRIIFGALLVSVALAGQGFGFELLNDLLGINRGGCNTRCEPECCEPACAPQNCEPACAPQNCEPNYCEPCCKPRCDLFAGLKSLFACKKSCCGTTACDPCGTACCEDPKCCTPEPNCCVRTCKPNCCEPNCCEPTCCRPRCTPIRDLLDDLCSLRIRIYCAPKRCCGSCCCEPGCCDDCGTPSEATPKEVAPSKELGPPPIDASASVRPKKYYRVSRSVVRN